jgi:DNA-binding NarL/FixJ family response regulator
VTPRASGAPPAERPQAAAPLDSRLALLERLTTREAQVLGCMARLMTNKEIAAELSIAHPTVKRHVSTVLGKLGVTTRRQAIVRAAALGLALPDRR